MRRSQFLEFTHAKYGYDVLVNRDSIVWVKPDPHGSIVQLTGGHDPFAVSAEYKDVRRWLMEES